MWLTQVQYGVCAQQDPQAFLSGTWIGGTGGAGERDALQPELESSLSGVSGRCLIGVSLKVMTELSFEGAAS